MAFYIAIGILVNFIWGSAFLVPHLIPTSNPISISIGRYLAYGVLSVCLLFLRKNSWKSLTKKQWVHAFILGFTGNIGYYAFLTSSIQLSGIAVPAMIIGVIPVLLMVCGNLIEKTFSFKKLIIPIVFIFIGMILFGIGHIGEDKASYNYGIGSLFAIICLLLWTYYGVVNARFLKENQNIPNSLWSEVIGATCLIQSLIAMPFVYIFTDDFSSSQVELNQNFWYLVIGCLYLGVVVSWLATLLWNKASRNLPVALSGQLIVFETISSLFYGYAIESSYPNKLEVIAIILVILGVIFGLRATKEVKLINATG